MRKQVSKVWPLASFCILLCFSFGCTSVGAKRAPMRVLAVTQTIKQGKSSRCLMMSKKGEEQIKQAGMKFLISADGTTLSTKGERANLYDQLIINPAYSKEWSGRSGVISQLSMGQAEFRAQVSDHLPVWASFWTHLDDD